MKRVLIALGLLLFPAQAMAAAFTCVGNVEYLGINSVGNVLLNNGSGVWTICSLSNTHGAITKEACAGWYSGLLTARASSRTVTLYFSSEENAGKTTCSALGTWTGPIAYFVQLD